LECLAHGENRNVSNWLFNQKSGAVILTRVSHAEAGSEGGGMDMDFEPQRRGDAELNREIRKPRENFSLSTLVAQ
jgi:hypothetical protein